MKVLGLDFETTGLDFERDRITEIGAVLWDTETGAPLQMMSELVLHGDSPGQSEEIIRLTGITPEMLQAHGSMPCMAFGNLKGMAHHACAVVAHNGTGFDRPMLEAQLEREPGALPWPALPWIDTCVDVEYPPQITTRKLTHLAAEHGFVNPFAHRAVFDVLTMLTVAQRYDWAAILESAGQPSLTIKALVSYGDREKAKARGYRWDAPTKSWRKAVKAHRLESERVACAAEFQLQEVEA